MKLFTFGLFTELLSLLVVFLIINKNKVTKKFLLSKRFNKKFVFNVGFLSET